MASRRGLQAAAPKLLSLGESGLVRELLLAQLLLVKLIGAVIRAVIVFFPEKE